jgi:peptide/nickel transport system ATP-binding protein
MAPPTDTVVDAHDVQVTVRSHGAPVVCDVSLRIGRGEVVGLVGESGSGKTSLALAMLGYAKPQLEVTGGEIRITGVDLLGRTEADLSALRGSHVSYVPQDPVASLNPARRIGTQLDEVLEQHRKGDAGERLGRVQEVLGEVGLPSDRDLLRRYPHQLSGGQLQRITIAMAFLCRPSAVVLDEPTTGLDVTTQAHVLETLRRMCRTHGVAALYVSHDLAVVAELSDRVAVMYSGRVVEDGPTREVLTRPAHPYTRRLLAAAPRLDDDRPLAGIGGTSPTPQARPPGCAFMPRCGDAIAACAVVEPDARTIGPDHQARCHRAGEPIGAVPVVAPTRSRSTTSSASSSAAPATSASPAAAVGRLVVEDLTASHGATSVVHDMSIDVVQGECVALVGESGSGKTTLARCVGGLHTHYSGRVVVDGDQLEPGAARRTVEQRRAVQYVFQNPYSSLNPRRTVREALALPIAVFGGRTAVRDGEGRILDVLEQVSLSRDHLHRFPAQLSGGERQRVAIARALIAEPRYLICDEVTSALDVSVQASILQLLSKLQADRGLGLLFVTHNLPLVRSIADRVVVLRSGRIVERGTVGHVFASPEDEYTRRLLDDVPRPDERPRDIAEVAGAPHVKGAGTPP